MVHPDPESYNEERASKHHQYIKRRRRNGRSLKPLQIGNIPAAVKERLSPIIIHLPGGFTKFFGIYSVPSAGENIPDMTFAAPNNLHKIGGSNEIRGFVHVSFLHNYNLRLVNKNRRSQFATVTWIILFYSMLE